MKLLTACALLLLPFGGWAQDAESDSAPTDPPPSAETPAEAAVPEHLGGLDVAVRTTVLVPVWDSFAKFLPGGGIGAEVALPFAQGWRATGALDTSSVGFADQTFFLAMVRPGIRYDAFFGPTAFMSFEIDGGWTLATQRNLAIVDNRACAGVGTSISFYLGSHMNFRSELRYVEVFGVLHAVTGSIGFEVVGN